MTALIVRVHIYGNQVRVIGRPAQIIVIPRTIGIVKVQLEGDFCVRIFLQFQAVSDTSLGACGTDRVLEVNFGSTVRFNGIWRLAFWPFAAHYQGIDQFDVDIGLVIDSDVAGVISLDIHCLECPKEVNDGLIK